MKAEAREVSELSTQTEGSGSPLAGRFVLLLLALCFCYVTYRALHLELTSDESELLGSIHRNRYRDLVRGVDWNSQAHFLNALLAKPCVKFLPVNEILASRVPCLLGLLLFLWGVWKVGTLFPTGLTRVLIALALVSNAFLLDYLGLSRGYGLALGFGMLSLFFVLEASLASSNGSVRRQAACALWLAAGAALSNMSFLYFYAAILMAALWLLLRNHLELGFQWCTSSALLGIFYLPRVLATRKQGSLFFGGDVGFVHDTVASLVRAAFYDRAAPTWLVGLLSVAVTLLVCFLAYWSYREGINGAFILSAMTVLAAAFCITADVTWDVKYPIERCALFFVPLVVLDIGVVAAWSRLRWLRLSLWGMLLVFTGVGLSGVNLSHTQTSRKNADIASVLLDLREMHEKTGQGIQIAFSDGSKWTTWYYAEHLLELHLAPADKERIYVRRFEWLTVYEWRGCQVYLVEAPRAWLFPGTTHLLLDENDARKLTQFPAGKVTELKFYPASGMRLFALTAPEYQGALRFPDGSVYVGGFKDGRANGLGTMTLPSGQKDVGPFVNGHLDGRGTVTWPDGSTYVGQLRDGLPAGQGTLTEPDGQQYVGEFQATNQFFQGTATWPDGRKYVGQFRDGKMEGNGKMTYPNGMAEEGVWESGRFLGSLPQ
jgi:hypothetical protein